MVAFFHMLNLEKSMWKAKNFKNCKKFQRFKTITYVSKQLLGVFRSFFVSFSETNLDLSFLV